MSVHPQPEILALLDVQERIIKVREDEVHHRGRIEREVIREWHHPRSGSLKAGCSGARVGKTGIVEVRKDLFVRTTVTPAPR